MYFIAYYYKKGLKYQFNVNSDSFIQSRDKDRQTFGMTWNDFRDLQTFCSIEGLELSYNKFDENGNQVN